MQNLDYNLALLITGGICWAGVKAHQWWRAKNATAAAAPAEALEGVKKQVSGVLTPPAGPAAVAAAPSPGRPRTAGGELDKWVAAQPPAAGSASVIRRAGRKFAASASTVKRALRRARTGPGEPQ
jgi:hypothetical protein